MGCSHGSSKNGLRGKARYKAADGARFQALHWTRQRYVVLKPDARDLFVPKREARTPRGHGARGSLNCGELEGRAFAHPTDLKMN